MVVFNGSSISKPPKANLPLQFPLLLLRKLEKSKINDKSENWMLWFSMLLCLFVAEKNPIYA